MKKRVRKEERGFVWYSLRLIFSVMLFLLGLSFFVNIILLNIIFFISLIFTIVLSIISLIKYKRRIFAIISLVISTLLLLFYIIGIAAII